MDGVILAMLGNCPRITTDGGATAHRPLYPETLTPNVNIKQVMYNGSIAVGIGYDPYPGTLQDKCMVTSTNPLDSNSWVVQRTHPFTHPTNNPYVIGWNGSYWLIYSCPIEGTVSTAGKISKSTDGINWTTVADIGGLNISNWAIKRFVWSGAFWIAVLNVAPSTNNVFLKSTDHGVTWTFVSNTLLTTVNDIQFNGSYFIATGTVANHNTNQSLIMKSMDCITWTAASISVPGQTVIKTYNPSWNGSYWLAAIHTVNQVGGVIKSDSTGTVWTVGATTASIPGFTVEHLAWDGIRWAAYAAGYYYASNDGNNWSKGVFNGSQGTSTLQIPMLRTLPTAPGAPRNVLAVAGTNSAIVSWSAPVSNGGSEITGYTVTSSSGSEVTVGNILTATIAGLPSGVPVTFTVVAINSAGTSSNSQVSSAVIPIAAGTVSGQPTSVLAIPGTNSAIVSWVAPASDGGSLITGYIVSPSIGAPMTVGNVLTATLTGLASIYSIAVRVYAINSAGTSLASEPSPYITPNPATVGPPSSVLGVTGIAGVASATINWTAPVSNGGSPITGYKIICVPDNRKPNLAGPDARSLVVTGLKNAVNTVFTVVALNTAGQSDSVALTSYPLPGAPRVAAVRGSSGVINLTWTARASHISSPITGYVVSLVSPLPASEFMVIPTPSVTLTGGSASIAGLTNGVSYVFAVKSVSSIGQSISSGLSRAMIAASTPNAPTAFVATKGLASAQLTWVAPVNTGGLPLTGYIISYTVAGVVRVLKVRSVTTAIIKGLVNGTAYTFTIEATNLVGKSIVNSSATVTPGP